MEEYVPTGTKEDIPKYVPAKLGPKKLTIEDYNRRQRRLLDDKLTAIPKVDVRIKKKRGGRLVRLRRKLAENLKTSKTQFHGRELKKSGWKLMN